jgi:WhiB family redox-sensing transcriptional regulator
LGRQCLGIGARPELPVALAWAVATVSATHGGRSFPDSTYVCIPTGLPRVNSRDEMLPVRQAQESQRHMSGSGASESTPASLDWQANARCRGLSTELFFSYDNSRHGVERERREQEVKQICQECPVIEACRSYAISAGEHYGIWGATTPRERRHFARRLVPRVHDATKAGEGTRGGGTSVRRIGIGRR